MLDNLEFIGSKKETLIVESSNDFHTFTWSSTIHFQRKSLLWLRCPGVFARFGSLHQHPHPPIPPSMLLGNYWLSPVLSLQVGKTVLDFQNNFILGLHDLLKIKSAPEALDLDCVCWLNLIHEIHELL